MSDSDFAREFWSERIFQQACFDAGLDSPEALAWRVMDAIVRMFAAAVADPANWGPPIRFRKTPRFLAQAARVTQALKHAKPGRFEPIR